MIVKVNVVFFFPLKTLINKEIPTAIIPNVIKSTMFKQEKQGFYRLFYKILLWTNSRLNRHLYYFID